MRITDIIKVLHLYIEPECNRYEYLEFISTLIMREPISDEEVTANKNGKYYPFAVTDDIAKKDKNRLNRLYNGENKIPTKTANYIRAHFDTQLLYEYFLNLERVAREKMVLDFKKIGILTEWDKIEIAVGELFELAIDSLSMGNEYFEIPTKYVYPGTYTEVLNKHLNEKKIDALKSNKKEKDKDKDFLEIFKELLLNQEKWREESNEQKSIWYYIYDPDFTIEYDHGPDETLTGYEYYLFTQYDSTPYWKEIRLVYKHTLLMDFQSAMLDSGRYFTPCPDWGCFHNENPEYETISYRYFIIDDLRWTVNKFFYDSKNKEQEICRDKFLDSLLLFESEDERIKFEIYAEVNWDWRDRYKEGINKINAHRYNFYNKIAVHYEKEYETAMILKNMLLEMRNDQEGVKR